MSKTPETKAPFLRKELTNLIPIISFLAGMIASCAEAPDVQVDPAAGSPPAEQLVDRIESSLTQSERVVVFDLATDFGSVLLRESLSELNQIGIHNPSLEFVLTQSPEGEWEPLVFTAGDNHYDFVSIYDDDEPAGVLLRNLDIPDVSHKRAVDAVRIFQYRVEPNDLKGISEEGDTVLALDNGWIGGEVNPDATIEVMTVDKEFQEAGFFQLKAEPSGERFVKLRMDTVRNPENEKELILQLTETAPQKTNESSIELIAFIPPTPEGFVPTEAVLTKSVEESGPIQPTTIVQPSAEPTATPTEAVLTLEQQLDEYIKTDEAKENIDQFVNAMQMAGIEISAEQVSQGLIIKELKDINNNPFLVATYNLNPDSNQTGETLEGPIPLTIAEKNEGGEWIWSNVTLRRLANKVGIKFGVQIPSTDERILNLIKTQFNEGIAWVAMDYSQPKQGEFDYSCLEYYGNFTNKNNMTIAAMPLIWPEPETLPEWIINGNFNKNELTQIVKDHIKKIVSSYPNVSSWVVINEPYKPPERTNDIFERTIGSDYINIAFQAAREANSSAKLIYNDTNNHTPNGSMTLHTIETVSQLKLKGLVDYVGVQMHIDASNPPKIEDIVKAFKSYPVPVVLTEFDVNLTNVYGENEDRFLKQAQIYEDVIRACIQSGVCQDIRIWGVKDSDSIWEIGYNQPNADPLLFFDDLSPKPSLFAILKALLP